jgi:superfamily II DNA/RNA helicase
LSFENLKLDEKLLRAIEACHYKEPTAIQREAIPVALAGRDLMASAQTGTGKTAAFVLPALQKLLTPSGVKGRGPRVLVLTPTRELAMQVSDNIKQFGSHCKVTSGSIVGGMSYGPQLNLLGRPLDLLVATPGRLMDHMERGRVDFSRLEILVLDEADRMLDMGFVDAVRDIAKATPPRSKARFWRSRASCSRTRRASSSPTTRSGMRPSPSRYTRQTTTRTSTRCCRIC